MQHEHAKIDILLYLVSA